MQKIFNFLIRLYPICFVCVSVGPLWHFNMYLGKVYTCSCIDYMLVVLVHTKCLIKCPNDILVLFGLRWVPNFRDYNDYACLSCFDHWLCVLHTLTQMCFVMPWSCITYAHHMHTWCTHSFTWHVLHITHAR